MSLSELGSALPSRTVRSGAPVRIGEDRSLIFLGFVFPLACYCLFLALINRGRHPVLISGPWDFAGILLATSGFLLLGGPAALTGLYEEWRMSWLLGQTRFVPAAGEAWYFWLALWTLYFAIIVGGSAAILWRRRSRTSIYNIDTAAFHGVLDRAIDSLEMEAFSHGPGRLVIHHRGRAAREYATENAGYSGAGFVRSLAFSGNGGELGAVTVGEHQAVRSPNSWIELELETFPAMRHVTLHWRGDALLRRDLVNALATALSQVRTQTNPVGAWLLSAAVCLFFLSAFGLLAVVFLRALPFLR